MSRLLTLLILISTLPVWALEENRNPTFNSPFGIAVNSKDVVYVAEIRGKRIAKLDASGNLLGEIRNIDGYGPLEGPFDVAVGPEDRIYITDTLAHRIVVLDANEKLLFALGTGIKGAQPGEFSQPHFIAVNKQGEIFISDTFNARVEKFSPEGKFIKEWGKAGDGPGEFLQHGYVARIDVDNQGFVYVREFDGGRIQKFTEDGQYVATFSRRGNSPGELDEGYGLSVIDNKLFCPDTFESRVQIFNLDGKLETIWAPGEGNEGEHFNHPVDIAALSTGDLVMTDWKNDRVLKLKRDGKFIASWGRSMTDLLGWTPPKIIERPTRGPVRLSIYAGTDQGTLEKAHRAGVTTIYPSIDMQYQPWPLKEPVELGKSQGIEIHPSIACLSFGQGRTNSSIYHEHPEWCLWKKGSTEPMKTLLGWAHPGARSLRADHLVAQVKATGVQGIMLDYIRYLGTDYGYDPVLVDGFFRKFGVNPLTLPQDDLRWMQYRADFVTEFIVELRHKLAVEIPDRHVEISVYLSGDDPDPKIYLKGSLQDWRTWARMGIVDTLHVAQYTRDLDAIYTAVRRVREVVPDRVKVNSFIACYGGNLNTPELLRKGYQASVAAGADEVTIYRGDAIEELNLWDAIRLINK